MKQTKFSGAGPGRWLRCQSCWKEPGPQSSLERDAEENKNFFKRVVQYRVYSSLGCCFNWQYFCPLLRNVIELQVPLIYYYKGKPGHKGAQLQIILFFYIKHACRAHCQLFESVFFFLHRTNIGGDTAVSFLRRRVPGFNTLGNCCIYLKKNSSKKSREVPRSPAKSREVPRSPAKANQSRRATRALFMTPLLYENSLRY